MGKRVTIGMIAALAAMPLAAQAQDNGAQEAQPAPTFRLPGTARPTGPERQGPEIDVFRAPANTPAQQQLQQQPATPAPTTPTITPPPRIVVPTVVPAARPATEPERRTRPTAPAQTPRRTAPEQEVEPTPAPPPVAASPAPAPPVAAPAEPSPRAGSQPAPASPPAPPRPAQTAPAAPLWPWIAGAVGLLVAIALFFLRRPRATPKEKTAPEPHAAPEPRLPPKPAPHPTPTPAPAPMSTARPWIDLHMTVESARFTLMGLSVVYRLDLHNRGEAPAQEILVHALMAGADTGQQDELRRFFAGQAGMPVHSIVEIAPGATESLRHELRIPADAIAPMDMQRRSVLVPLIAFDAHYHWADGAAGRTGGVFIVGEEQAPPTDRLLPLRIDLGPRQYRAASSRPADLSLAS